MVCLCYGCVCYVECTQLAFARNWIMHLDLFEENQKGNTWKCEKPPPPYRNLSDPKLGLWRIENTQNKSFTNPFSSIPNDIPTKITIKSDRDLLTDGLGAPNNSPTARLLKTIQAFWKNDSILRISPRTNYYKYRNFRNSSTQFSETGICLKCKRKWIYLNLSFSWALKKRSYRIWVGGSKITTNQCWRWKVLVTTIICWWRFSPFRPLTVIVNIGHELSSSTSVNIV